MADVTYRIEWDYLDELPDVVGGPYEYEDAHCSFRLRLFARVGEAHDQMHWFGMNIVTAATAARLGIAPQGRRGYFVADGLTKSDFRARVAADVGQAIDALPRAEALARLDQIYVWEDKDFRDEFGADAPSAEALEARIEEAFAGVTRGEGVTLHEALAMDDWAGPEECAAARLLDRDEDWHDAPRDFMAAQSEFFSYLDPAGYRYYLPAAMLLSLDATQRSRSDTPRRTYSSLLPLVAPRDHGKGLGEAFDPESFISEHGFSDRQVVCIYAFLCFMAVEGDEGVNEDQLPAMRKWRDSARRRTG